MTNDPREPGQRHKQFSLVVPCYNEAASLEYTVPALTRAFAAAALSVELVLVDNGSTDGTAAAIDRFIAEGLPVRKVVVSVNQGKGHGLIQGFASAESEWIGFVDADCPVSPEAVSSVLQMAAASGRPVLVTVRRRFRLDGWQRRLLSTVMNVLAAGLFPGLGAGDLNANPKVWPRAFMDQLRPASHGWTIDIELLIKAHRLGLPIVEVNAICQPRPAGRSHVTNWRAAWHVFWALLRFRISH